MIRNWLIRFGLMAALAVLPAAFAQDEPAKGRGYIPLTQEKRAKLHAENSKRHGPQYMARMAENATPPAAFDAVALGWVQPIQDQGSCGSCYLVSTMDGLTGSGIKAGYGKNDGTFRMSDQWGMDCHNFGGCNGGNGTEVIEYIRTHGAPAEKYTDAAGLAHNDYPSYIARSSTCRTKVGAKMWTCDWGFVSADTNRAATVAEIKAALMAHGQLNISLDAGGQFSGSGTIMQLGTSIDHEISLTGWDDSKNAFIIRNQWGSGWGSGGYRYLDYGAKATGRIVDVFWMSMTPVVPPQPVTVTPATATLSPGSTQQYTADKNPVTWTTTGGSITAGGLLTAPQATGTFTVSASIPGNQDGTASFTVSAGPLPPPSELAVSGSAVKVFTVVEQPSDEKPLIFTAAPGAKLYFWQDSLGGSSKISPSNVKTYTACPVGKLTVECQAVNADWSVNVQTKTVTVGQSPEPPSKK